MVLPLLVASAGVCRADVTNTAAQTDSYRGTYEGYRPSVFDGFRGGTMKLSTETPFYTLSRVDESDRVNALITAADAFERQMLFKEAIEAYVRVIDEYPNALYRVHIYGVFVSASAYAQMRLLRLPPRALAIYREKYDPHARALFEQARAKHSLEILSELSHTGLATSYGGRAVLALGDAALDRGDFLEALECFSNVRERAPDKMLLTPELFSKIALCRRYLGDQDADTPGSGSAPSELSPDQLEVLRALVGEVKQDPRARLPRRISAPFESTEDHVPMIPSPDPDAVAIPVWRRSLYAADEHASFMPHAFSHAVATARSIVYRHKNIVYCRSILSGEQRWRYDLGGRIVWQRVGAGLQYPHETVIVQDGLVFTALHRIGPSLVALDEITGALRWSYGPMSATTDEEAHMRFMAAPVGGHGAVYAGYVLDDVRGGTQVATEYGIMAFESRTGRVKWRRPISILQPGVLSTGIAFSYRILVRSFSSPPLYHENTIYYCTNAGTVTAIDATSGRIKWVIKYPYHPTLHDMTKGFGALSYARGRLNPYGAHEPMFWFHQRPFLVGDELYVMPVDSALLLCIDRRTGKVRWTRNKDVLDKIGGYRYVLGPTSEGHLAIALSDGNIKLLDRMTGKMLWDGHVRKKTDNAALIETFGWKDIYGIGYGLNRRNFYLGAPPTLAQGDRLYTSYLSQTGPYDFGYTLAYALSETSLQARQPTVQHMYMHPDVVGGAADAILNAPGALKKVEEALDLDRLAGKDLAEEKNKRAALKRVMEAPFPENNHRAFAPFARLTFERLGVPFEFRIGAREVAMVYDRAGLDKIAGGKRDADSLFMSGELRLAENRLAEAADLFDRSLAAAAEEDLALRAMIKQQLYATHKRLTMACVRGRRPADEVRQSLEMSRAVTTLENEIESLLVIAEAFERNSEPDKAIQCLQKIIDVYGSQEYAVPRATLNDRPILHQAARNVLQKTVRYAQPGIYGETMAHTMGVVESCLPLYFGALSPVERDLTLTALGLATRRLMQLTQANQTLADRLDAAAKHALEGKPEEEQLAALPLFPGTPTANRILAERMLATHAAVQPAKDLSEQARLRRRLWSLSDVAAACGYEVPSALRPVVLAPDSTDAWRAPRAPFRDREIEMATAEDTLWLVLRRLDDGRARPDWLLVTGTVKKRVGFKTLLHAVDLTTGKTVWHATEKRFEEWINDIRLDDAAGGGGLIGGCIVDDTVVVYGLYDVLAFNVSDGRLKWRYRVPFDFTIRYPLLSGDLLVLSGEPETIALYLGTQAPNGEVAWQKKEQGALYAEPYLHGDRLVSVRKLPFNVTTRYRATGRLLGRIDLPTLSENTGHPLIENGPRGLPIDHDAECLIVTDSRYYLMLDVADMRIVWKRRIDDPDPTREPALRFEIKGDYLAVLKEDVDRKALHMLSSRTGELLWRTDPKSQRPQPVYSMLIEIGPPVSEGAPRAVLYGIRPHPGQGFYLVGMDAATGRDIFAPHEEAGYGGKPEVVLESRVFGQALVARIKDRQDFHNMALDKTTGKRMHVVTAKGSGDFGVAGRASSTVQNGSLALFALDRLKLAAPAE